MPDAASPRLTLRPIYLPIALLPALVFLLNQYLLVNYGSPLDPMPEAIAEFDAHRESAARIGTLATFMLFAGAAAAALGLFFISTLGMLDWRARLMTILAFLGLAGAAFTAQHLVPDRNAENYIGLSLTCLATGYTKEQSDEARRRAGPAVAPAPAPAAPNAAPRPAPQPPRIEVEHLPPPDCSNPGFLRLQRLMALQAVFVVLAFSGLVFSAICSLAEPPREALAAAPADAADPDEDPELQHWERQSERLNTCLYLAALLLGTALVFLNALLSWPGYVLIQKDAYEAYVSAMVSYYGFTFSVMLAAFYIPVATILATRVKAAARAAGGKAKLPEAFQGPLQILKIVLGLSSTALAGALPGIIELVA